MSFRRFLTLLLAALIGAVSFGRPAPAQDRRVPTSPAELKLSYAPLVKRVAPAVVNVYAARVVENRNPLLDDPVFRRFFGAGRAARAGAALARLRRDRRRHRLHRHQ